MLYDQLLPSNSWTTGTRSRVTSTSDRWRFNAAEFSIINRCCDPSTVLKHWRWDTTQRIKICGVLFTMLRSMNAANLQLCWCQDYLHVFWSVPPCVASPRMMPCACHRTAAVTVWCLMVAQAVAICAVVSEVDERKNRPNLEQLPTNVSSLES